MIGQTKLVIPSTSLLNQDLTRKTASLFHCSPGYSKMTFTNYHPVTHSFFTSGGDWFNNHQIDCAKRRPDKSKYKHRKMSGANG
jgi:hypothetical protein